MHVSTNSAASSAHLFASDSTTTPRRRRHRRRRLLAAVAWLPLVVAAAPAASATTPVAGTAGPVTSASAVRADRGCARSVWHDMNLPQRVGQLFMTGVDQPPTSAQLRRVRRLHLGSVLLAHNSDAGVSATSRISRRLRHAGETDGVEPWIATDQEGGFVQHLSGPGFDDIPTALEQGHWSASDLRERARPWAAQLRRGGVSLDLAPVADTVSASLGEQNRPIGYYDREYAHRPVPVARHVAAVRHALADEGVEATVKHFPGLGRVRGNTDTTVGVTDHTTARGGRYYLRPFRQAIGDGASVVMVSNARYSRIDAHHIAPMSSTIMRGMLRDDLGFEGVVLSDSLTAAALSRVPVARRAVRFVKAGGDLALVGTGGSATETMYDALLARARHHHPFRRTVNAAALRVLQVKQSDGLLSCD